MEKVLKESNSHKETYDFGYYLGQNAKPGEIYCLEGDLGTGKTVFSQGFGAGVGVTDPISSPTFTIVREYHEGRLPFYHFDVYRIGSDDEMEEVGYYDMINQNGVCLIEWATLIENILPTHYKNVVIKKDLEKGFDYRLIEVEAR